MPPPVSLQPFVAFPVILASRCRNNEKSHTIGMFPLLLPTPRRRAGCEVRGVCPLTNNPQKRRGHLFSLSVCFQRGNTWQGTGVKRRVEIFSCSKYYPSERGGDLRNGKILPDLYACDGQVILSVKQTEGRTDK